MDCFVAIALHNDSRLPAHHHTAAQRPFSRLPKSRDRRSIGPADPIMGRLQVEGGGEWDKTSEVPEVHGALRLWALSKAVQPPFSKQSWREQAPSPKPAASMPEPPTEMPVPKPAITR